MPSKSFTVLSALSLLFLTTSCAKVPSASTEDPTPPTPNPQCIPLGQFVTETGASHQKLRRLGLAVAGFPLDSDTQKLGAILANVAHDCLQPVINTNTDGDLQEPIETLAPGNPLETEEEAIAACIEAATARNEVEFDLTTFIIDQMLSKATSVFLNDIGLYGLQKVVEVYEMVGDLARAVPNDPAQCSSACPCDKKKGNVCLRTKVRNAQGQCVPASQAGGGKCPVPNFHSPSTCSTTNEIWKFAYGHTQASFSNFLCGYLSLSVRCDPTEPFGCIGGHYNEKMCCELKCDNTACHNDARIYRSRGFIDPSLPEACEVDALGKHLLDLNGDENTTCRSLCNSL